MATEPSRAARWGRSFLVGLVGLFMFSSVTWSGLKEEFYSHVNRTIQSVSSSGVSELVDCPVNASETLSVVKLRRAVEECSLFYTIDQEGRSCWLEMPVECDRDVTGMRLPFSFHQNDCARICPLSIPVDASVPAWIRAVTAFLGPAASPVLLSSGGVLLLATLLIAVCSCRSRAQTPPVAQTPPAAAPVAVQIQMGRPIKSAASASATMLESILKK